MNFYNDSEEFACEWMRNLIAEGMIGNGVLSEKKIQEIDAADISGFQRVHLFSGIGGWEYALRLAGWPEGWLVWTGSCPCQPFSGAGRRKGIKDERHLWPEMFRLIKGCRPPVVFGEQVASPAGIDWMQAVQSDLEGEGYEVGKLDLCAAGIGAPHIRQRIFWAAYCLGEGLEGFDGDGSGGDKSRQVTESPAGPTAKSCGIGRLGYSNRIRVRGEPGSRDQEERDSWDRQVGDSAYSSGQVTSASATQGFWSDPDWLFCRDGKWRPVEPGTFPLAHGVSNRVGTLRGYGNAIVPQVAAWFIKQVIEWISHDPQNPRTENEADQTGNQDDRT